MFFIMGMSQGEKQLDYSKTVICGECGRYGRYEVFMTYMYLSIFFIPLFKWNKRYYVRMSCCGTVYELDPAVGSRIAAGENAAISPSDLHKVSEGRPDYYEQSRRAYAAYAETAQEQNENTVHNVNNEPQKMLTGASEAKTCAGCGYIAPKDFEYCPKCGRRL